MTDQRYTHLLSLLQNSSLDAIMINPGSALRYLTGLNFHLMERPTVMLITREGKTAMVIPELELIKLDQSRIMSKGFTFGDNPEERLQGFKNACSYLGVTTGTMGVESTRIRFLEMNMFSEASGNHELVAADELFAQLRVRKDADEIALMQKAVQIAQDALSATIPSIRAGVSEKQIASELTIQLLKHGGDPEMPFAPIVSAGENGANPHASPSDRILQNGDLVVIDWGAFYDGYASDLTRTFAIGDVEPEFRKIHEVVQAANAAGQEASAPNKTCGSVDQAARNVIDTAGYGKQFTHRVGHGLGMEPHEEPYMFTENTRMLEPGMTFTVEPGIYFTGRAGVRIEDNMVITETGSTCLSDFPRELITLPA